MNQKHQKHFLAFLVGTAVALLPLAALAQDPDTIGEDVVPPSNLISQIFATNSEALFTLLAGALIPWAVALIVMLVDRAGPRPWGPVLKQALVFVVCAVVAAVYLWMTDATVFAWDGTPRLFIILAGIAYGFFRMYRTPIDALEERVNRPVTLQGTP